MGTLGGPPGGSVEGRLSEGKDQTTHVKSQLSWSSSLEVIVTWSRCEQEGTQRESDSRF